MFKPGMKVRIPETDIPVTVLAVIDPADLYGKGKTAVKKKGVVTDVYLDGEKILQVDRSDVRPEKGDRPAMTQNWRSSKVQIV